MSISNVLSNPRRTGSFGPDVDPLLFAALSCADVSTGLQATVRAAIDVLGGPDGLAIADFESIFFNFVAHGRNLHIPCRP